MKKAVAVLGAGAYGTALAAVLARKGYTVSLSAHSRETARQINEGSMNDRHLPGIPLPPGIRCLTDPVEALEDQELAILAVPSLYILPLVKKIIDAPSIREGETQLAVVTKGFLETRNGPGLILETLENYLPGFYKENLVYISGPSHAEELARGKLTGLISASRNPRRSIIFRETLASETLKVYSSLDVVGVQIAAALKNVAAIAFGILDALKEESEIFGDNAESLLLAVGLNEIQSMGRTLGATHPETFTSIAGVGDLDVTCRSPYGRNRRFGREIISKDLLSHFTSMEDLIDRIHKVGYLPEGVMACRFAWQFAEKKKLKIPLMRMVYRILNKEASPREAIRELMLKG